MKRGRKKGRRKVRRGRERGEGKVLRRGRGRELVEN